ncbi:ABC transporter ATP-binding protein [Anaeromicropila populeti]|uniref:Putative ABC transport system ATP-binding protein n=1 Tax=Anaeromicropila populeti TaxID=37658 RepID=A0A1I6ILM0_9FIRM|nr:ATP-binding cassette domain-containing protein [Anaeromicropila populeti]SFR67667.1 putative ABC transport system ATP-binding protein [Anaeromicropila populeti]
MIEITSMSKTFNAGTTNENKALDDVSLTIRENEFITVIGGNGAGKSTLINCISGMYKIDTGTIQIEKEDVTPLPVHKRAKYIGMVFQDPLKGTVPSMTIRENLIIAYIKNQFHGLQLALNKKKDDMFREKLQLLGLGLEDKLNYKVGLLSGGQRQALSLLMSTIHIPKLLLLDEHTSALDPFTSEKVLKITNDIVTQNRIPTIMITHNMEHALQYGNRTIMMNRGKIIMGISDEEKKKTSVNDLIQKFSMQTEENAISDRMVL